jgi:methylated-DNA-[protein]-cysteine S-methyltransferase
MYRCKMIKQDNNKQKTVMHLYPAPFGKLGLYMAQNKLAGIDFSPLPTAEQPAQPVDDIQQIYRELHSYFQNPAHLFNLELSLTGTPFQQKVWQALRNIPSGATLSYNVLAKQLMTSPRAIGNACRANPIPIIIPCHRIVAQNHIGGYAGATQGTLLNIKKWLLQHEALS